MVRMPHLCSAALVSLTLVVTSAIADRPPADAKPISALIRSVEQLQLGAITSAEFDDGLLEVKVREGDRSTKLYIDPISGEERRRSRDDNDDDRPPADAKPLSGILSSLEAERIGVIEEVEFDDGYWEIEARDGDRKVKVEIDPVTGERRPRR